MSSNITKPAPRKGANGVLLKKFEATLQHMFSLPSTSSPSPQVLDALMPQYSVQPPRLSDEEINELMENARSYWREIGLKTHHEEDHPKNNDEPSPWPFDEDTSLPSIGHVRQSQDPSNAKAKTTKTKTGKDTGGVGDILHSQRAWRKEAQLANLIHCVLSLLPDVGHITRKIRIVDFAGGTGHLAVPLALLLPDCEVVCVDLKKWSLDLLHRRVDLDAAIENTTHIANEAQATKVLPNLFTYHGSIQSYSEPFDIGVSLHACGEASDWTLRKCLEKDASFVICSCCCGKLSRDAANPYTYHSTGANENEIQYPQSKVFATLGQCCNCTTNRDPQSMQRMTPEMFDEIAKAADYSELGDLRKPRNACRRAAKSLIEWDRLLFAQECLNVGTKSSSGNGSVVLTRMLPWEASTKNDILIGWPYDTTNPYHMLRENGAPDAIPNDATCDTDFQTALNHLFGSDLEYSGDVPINTTIGEANDWTATEEEEIKLQIESFIRGNETRYRFNTGMGSRQRKLIHNVAEKMGLRHWGEGKKEREKTVVVARRAYVDS